MQGAGTSPSIPSPVPSPAVVAVAKRRAARSADSFDMDTPKQRMADHIAFLKTEFSSLRGGRITANQLDHVIVRAYGDSKTPLKSVAQMSLRPPNTLLVNVHDASLTSAVQTAIRDCGLSLNPVVGGGGGNSIAVQFPLASKEMRDELIKVAAKKAEEARVKIRNVRRDAMDALKRAKDSMGKDDQHRVEKMIQKATDDANKQVDSLLAAKEKEINTV